MRRTALLLIPLLLLSGTVAGCKPDRRMELRKAIAKLKEERVPKEVVAKAKQDADDAERAVEQREQALSAVRDQLAKLVAEGKGTAEAFNRQVARNQDLRREIDRTNQEIVAARKQHQELAQEIAHAKERAGYLRDQAVTLARQIRPGDPAWANARRIQNLSQVLHDAAKAYPKDPVLARLARSDLGTTQQPAVAKAVSTAQALRDRLRWVYGLDAKDVAAGPPPVSARRR